MHELLDALPGHPEQAGDFTVGSEQAWGRAWRLCAAVDSGSYPHSFQMRQTGKVVSPQLFVVNGSSGAIQHRGMQTSKAIVAVDRDAEAPIFELVDFGVVGYLRTVFAVSPRRSTSASDEQPSATAAGPGKRVTSR